MPFRNEKHALPILPLPSASFGALSRMNEQIAHINESPFGGNNLTMYSAKFKKNMTGNRSEYSFESCHVHI